MGIDKEILDRLCRERYGDNYTSAQRDELVREIMKKLKTDK